MVFSLSALCWRKIRSLWKLPDGRDWLRGNLSLVLMGGAVISNSWIQFSVDGWRCVPSIPIPECSVKWAIGSITTHKARGGDGIPVELKSEKMRLWKCCTQYASQFGKLTSGYRTGKGQFSFQSQRKTMPKHVQTTVQLHSSHELVK